MQSHKSKFVLNPTDFPALPVSLTPSISASAAVSQEQQETQKQEPQSINSIDDYEFESYDISDNDLEDVTNDERLLCTMPTSITIKTVY